MGVQVSKMMGKIFGTKEMRILMLGLDAAGKTSKTEILSRELTKMLTLLSNFVQIETQQPGRDHHPHRRIQRRERHL